MKVGDTDDSKKKFCDLKIFFCKVTSKYDCLVVFIRKNSAEIWGFIYGLALGIGTLKIMARTGVFVHVIFDLKRSLSYDVRTSSMISTKLSLCPC
jgi:sulfite exporter TauE/SafE